MHMKNLLFLIAGAALSAVTVALTTPKCKPVLHSERLTGFWRVSDSTDLRGGKVRVRFAQDTCTACPNRADGNEKRSWWLPAAPGLSGAWRYGSATITDTLFTFHPSPAPDPIRPAFRGTAEEAVALTLEGGVE
jgi:hypothetical protein